MFSDGHTVHLFQEPSIGFLLSSVCNLNSWSQPINLFIGPRLLLGLHIFIQFHPIQQCQEKQLRLSYFEEIEVYVNLEALLFCDRDCPSEWSSIEGLFVPNIIYLLEKKRAFWALHQAIGFLFFYYVSDVFFVVLCFCKLLFCFVIANCQKSVYDCEGI